MEYLWDKEKANNFAYWLEDKCKQDSKASYWQQIKDPKEYFNSDKYLWAPLSMELGMPDEKYSCSIEKKTPMELVPTELHEYLTVFKQEALE